MNAPSPLAEVLRRWADEGGDLSHALADLESEDVAAVDDAIALCRALSALAERCGEERSTKGRAIGSPLNTLAGLFQQVQSDEASELLRDEGLPLLRDQLKRLLDEGAAGDDDAMFLVKILALYRQPQDLQRIVRVARLPRYENSYLWSVVMSVFDDEHPDCEALLEALREPLPGGFLRVALLDLANGRAISGSLRSHPFDTPAGRASLEAWLLDSDEQSYSFAHSATAALPFIEPSSCKRLLPVALQHPDTSVRIEASWASARCGERSGLTQLAGWCLDPGQSYVAQHYLDELGQMEMIPAAARDPDFQAVAEMAHWLAHPNEFGRPPDEIELIDRRELFWPPTGDRRPVWLCRYAYDDAEDERSEEGIGMVGSVTFALFGEATADMPPEDVYGLHCAWELELNDHPAAPPQPTAEAGRRILARHNPGF